MTWGAIAGAAIGVVDSAMSNSGGGGGGQTQTVSKDPWSAADPWLRANLASGQGLQNYYQQNPFSETQRQAYSNQFANSDYLRKMTGSLLGNINQHKPFDRSSPLARPQGMQFGAMPQSTPYSVGQSMFANPYQDGRIQPLPNSPSLMQNTQKNVEQRPFFEAYDDGARDQ